MESVCVHQVRLMWILVTQKNRCVESGWTLKNDIVQTLGWTILSVLIVLPIV